MTTRGRMIQVVKTGSFAVLLGGLLLSCSDGADDDVTSDDDGLDDSSDDDPNAADDADDDSQAWDEPSQLDDALETYADIVFTSYQDSLASAEALDEAIAKFVAEPSQEGLDAARQAWLDAREPYLQTEVFRFYEGPIDNEDDGPEGLLNAWPLDENHIDYVEGKPGSGLINDTDFEISKQSLAEQNEKGGEKNIATGYHAIEFLLWGQDMSDDGPGDRPYTDYLTDDDATAENGDRRADYLSTVSALMLDHLQSLVEAWDPETDGNYRAAFVTGGMDSLEKIVTGMIVLSGFETGGERLRTALDLKDQEEEHSCFSDNTHRDMWGNAKGVQNVYLGQYGDVEGVGILDLVKQADAELADELETMIAASVEAAAELEPPFDQEIAPGNDAGHKRVKTLIDALFAQEEKLEDVFHGYGFSVPQPE